MKTLPANTVSRSTGFTLVELLVVIAIIATLAGLLIPAVGIARQKAAVARAKSEINNIVTAINAYRQAYGRYPVPKEAEATAAGHDGNFTFGFRQTYPDGAWQLSTDSSEDYLGDNRGVIAILMARDVPPNAGHARNPRKNRFLDAKEVDEITKSGVGPDGVYRDPWGNPYIITLDLNYDDLVEDRLYREIAVSAIGGDTSQPGFGGHVYDSSRNFFQARQGVMVWSLGPDGGYNLNPASSGEPGAKVEPNKDNVTSWQ